MNTKKTQIRLPKIKLKPTLFIILGCAILSFGLYNIHSISDVTEGGVMGMTLLLHHLFNISPAVSGLIMNAVCYIIGWRVLGIDFIAYSVIAGSAFSLFYFIFEQFPPIWPGFADHPLAASIAGALFIGIGAGIAVRAGGAPSGDDSLAMALSKKTGIKLQWIYLISDLMVLVMSICYIPIRKIAYSILTVILSGQILGVVQKVGIPRKKNENKTDLSEN